MLIIMLPCILKFEIGDQVIVNSDRDTVKRLQEGHGGYNYEMAKVDIYE